VNKASPPIWKVCKKILRKCNSKSNNKNEKWQPPPPRNRYEKGLETTKTTCMWKRILDTLFYYNKEEVTFNDAHFL